MSLISTNRFFSFRRHREYTSNSEEPSDTPNTEAPMSRRMIVPPESVSQHHYVPPSPAQSFNYARQQPTPPPQRKHVQHDPTVFVDRTLRENDRLIGVFFFFFVSF